MGQSSLRQEWSGPSGSMHNTVMLARQIFTWYILTTGLFVDVFDPDKGVMRAIHLDSIIYSLIWRVLVAS